MGAQHRDVLITKGLSVNNLHRHSKFLLHQICISALNKLAIHITLKQLQYSYIMYDHCLPPYCNCKCVSIPVMEFLKSLNTYDNTTSIAKGTHVVVILASMGAS